MRVISVGIMFNTSFGLQNVLNLFQTHFQQSIMHNYQALQPKNSSAALYFWEKLGVDDDFNTLELKITLEAQITDSVVFINELLPLQTRKDKYLPYVVSAIISITGLVAGYFF